MLEKIKNAIKNIEVKDLSTMELYYLLLILKMIDEIPKCKILSYGVEAKPIITEEDYCD